MPCANQSIHNYCSACGKIHYLKDDDLLKKVAGQVNTLKVGDALLLTVKEVVLELAPNYRSIFSSSYEPAIATTEKSIGFGIKSLEAPFEIVTGEDLELLKALRELKAARKNQATAVEVEARLNKDADAMRRDWERASLSAIKAKVAVDAVLHRIGRNRS